MVTPRKKWPTECEYARMDSIALADRSWRILDALLDELDSASQVRQVGRVMADLKEIIFKLTICKDGRNQTKETQP
jgi:Zn-dependent M32 family carboxypeptidase